MNKHYVTYPQAVKLKELGFDWECLHYYYKDGLLFSNSDSNAEGSGIYVENLQRSYNKKDKEYYIDAPRLDQAQEWLREEKRIHVEPYFVYETRFELYIKSQAYSVFKREEQCFDTYESALSAGIDKALELLNNKS